MNAFYLLLIIQIALLGVLVWNVKAHKSPTAMFSPISWFVLFYALSLLLPQCALPANGFTIERMSGYLGHDNYTGILKVQCVLVLFLAVFTLVYLLSTERLRPERRLYPLTPVERDTVLVVGGIGLLATLWIALQSDLSAPRSGIVASNTGKLFYALTYWYTVGFIGFAAHLLKSKRHIAVVVTTLIFASSLFVLGGRGRVLWPLVGLVAWAGITGCLKISLTRLVLASVAFAVVLVGMDPLLFYLRGMLTAGESWSEFQAGLSVENLFVSKNFDCFQFISVIVICDGIPQKLHYLFYGSQRDFMESYFPSVAASGVGFPATLPGGLWLCGGWPLVAIGAAVFGLWFGILTRFYARMQSQLEAAVYVALIPWLANVGTSLLDSHAKIAAVVLPGVLLMVIFRFRSARQNALRALAKPHARDTTVQAL